MHSQPRPQHAVMGLIDGYLSGVMVGRIGPFGLSPHVLKAMEQLDKHPGRWGLIFVKAQPGYEAAGMYDKSFSRAGYELVTVNGKTYARKPHPSGLPIDAVVTRQKPRVPSDALPAVTPDVFGWSANELHHALATAKSWLFPIEGTQAA